MKTTQLSTRVEEDDADFLASLRIEGAVTPSDKLRALIAEERRRREELGDYAGSLRQIRALIGPATERILQVENGKLPHSELVLPVVEWLSEALAFVLSHIPDGSSDDDVAESAARALEAGLADRAFRLVGNVLRLGVTHEAECYDRRAIAKRLGPILEIAQVVKGAREATAEGKD